MTPEPIGSASVSELLATRLVDWASAALQLLVVAAVGLVLAFVLGRALRWVVRSSGLEALGERVGGSRFLYAVGYKKGLAELAGTLGRWIALIVTLAVASEILGLDPITEGVSAVVAFLPQVLLAVLILVIGLWGADGISALTATARSEERDDSFAARLVYWVVTLVSVTLAFDQLGVETRLVNALLMIAGGAVAAAFALAFALGARSLVSDVVSVHYARRLFRPGDRIEFDGAPGTVVRYTPTAIILHADRGEVVVPCHLMMSAAVRVERVATEAPADPARA